MTISTNTVITQNNQKFSLSIDQIILIIIASIGLICSAFVLNENTSNFNPEPVVQSTPTPVDIKSDFDKYVTISGDKIANSELSFDLNLDINQKRYVMEMGDGRRMIITQNKFNYKYTSKGEYLLELKEIQRGLITLVGEKTLKIKEQ